MTPTSNAIRHRVSNPGRTCWLFVNYVQPVLDRRHAQRFGSADGAPVTPARRAQAALGLDRRQPRRADLVRVHCPGTTYELIALCRPDGSPSPRGPGEIPAEATRRLTRAVALVERTGLLFYLQLALGVVLVAESTSVADATKVPADIAVVPVDADPHDLACRLLDAATRSWADHAVTAERELRGGAPLEAATGNPLRDVYVMSVRHQFLSRLLLDTANDQALRRPLDGVDAELRRRSTDLAARLNELVDQPLSKDLVCCAFPLWPIDEFSWRNSHADVSVRVPDGFGAPTVFIEGL